MFRPGHVPRQVVFALAVMATGVSYGLAQGTPPADSEASPDTSVDVVRVQPLSDSSAEAPQSVDAMLDRAEEIRTEAQGICAEQRQMVIDAKNDNDIIRATCVDDKVAQCDANLQNLNSRVKALEDAKDSSQRAHEMTVIETLRDKFVKLRAAGNQCIGQDIFDTGDTTVRPTIDPFSPDENAALPPPIPAWPVPYIPPPVSGTS